jgi:hypothetical protein
VGWGGVADGVGGGFVFQHVDGGAKCDVIGLDFGGGRDDVFLKCGEFERWERADVDLGFEWDSEGIWNGCVDVGHERWGCGFWVDGDFE